MHAIFRRGVVLRRRASCTDAPAFGAVTAVSLVQTRTSRAIPCDSDVLLAKQWAVAGADPNAAYAAFLVQQWTAAWTAVGQRRIAARSVGTVRLHSVVCLHSWTGVAAVDTDETNSLSVLLPQSQCKRQCRMSVISSSTMKTDKSTHSYLVVC